MLRAGEAVASTVWWREARSVLDSAERLERATWNCLCVFAFAIPWSIALSETTLVITAAVSARHHWVSGRRIPRTALDRPILAFFAAGLLAALAGLDVSQSLWGLRTYLVAVTIYLVFAYVRTNERMVRLLVLFLAGMTMTSVHTVFNAVSVVPLPELFPGGMTESGQLLFAVGIATALRFANVLSPSLLSAALGLYILALVANLKRGAWLGTLVTILAIGLVRSRRLIVASLLLLIMAVGAVPPVQRRIQHTVHDFMLPGSRYDIWSAAVDVVRRFPMGVGRKNGTILRDYPNIPQRHKHAHNNLLQITLENGFLGLAAFVWWMTAFGAMGWGLWRRLAPEDRIGRAIAVAAFSTFAGFHVAGLVEYNFGDSEVLMTLFVLMGLTLALRERAGADTARQSEKNGSPSEMVSSRPAPTDTILTGTPISSSSRSK